MKVAILAAIGFAMAVSASAQSQPAGYEYGTFLLDARKWDEAAKAFDAVAAAAAKDARADAALYWKAYALNRNARREEALAALDLLRKTYPMSRWLQDGAALEMEIRQSAGESISPETAADEETKLLALNALARTDPDRAIPAVENLLKQSHSPTFKRNAVYVLAQTGSPAAQKVLERVAREGTPDVQVLALTYFRERKLFPPGFGQTLFEIYNASRDKEVRRAAVLDLAAIGDVEHLRQLPDDVAQAAASDLPLFQRRLAITLGLAVPEARDPQPIVADYLRTTERTAKEGIIEANAKAARTLIALARVENDPLLKKRIVKHLIEIDTAETREFLLELLK